MSIKDTLIEEYRKSENFPVASRAIPKKARKIIRSIYQFARTADNICDNSKLSKESARKQLNVILNNLENKQDQKLPKWAQSFAYNCRIGNISVRHGKALLMAFIKDTEKSRYNSWEETLDYCQGSAATIGRLVLEANEEYSADFLAADKICVVLQLINHLQDLKEDFVERDRVYFDKNIFPVEIHLQGDSESAEVTRGKHYVIAKLKRMMEEAESLPKNIKSFRVRTEIITIINLANKLIDMLGDNDILASKVKLSKKDKFFAFVKAFLKCGFSNKNLESNGDKNENIAKASSFLRPMLKLDSQKRSEMLCFYAFCRMIDDATDKTLSKPQALEKIRFWQNEINKIYSQNFFDYPDHSVTKQLLSVIEKYDISQIYFNEMIEGQLMDINELMLKPERKIFYLYCYRVASCVGIITTKILGYKKRNESAINSFATHLGKGFQIINIIRDIKEDAESGRIYIPQRVLVKQSLVNVEPEELAENFDKYKEQIAEAAKSLAELAKEHFLIAEENLPTEERDKMHVPLLMSSVYKKYLRKMEKREYIFDRRDIKLSKLDKIKIFTLGK